MKYLKSYIFKYFIGGKKHLKYFTFRNILFYLYFMTGDILWCVT